MYGLYFFYLFFFFVCLFSYFVHSPTGYYFLDFLLFFVCLSCFFGLSLQTVWVSQNEYLWNQCTSSKRRHPHKQMTLGRMLGLLCSSQRNKNIFSGSVSTWNALWKQNWWRRWLYYIVKDDPWFTLFSVKIRAKWV